jgi:hypothetical protein
MKSPRHLRNRPARKPLPWQPGSARGNYDHLLRMAQTARPDNATRKLAVDLMFSGEKIETGAELLEGFPMSMELAQVGRAFQALAGGRGASPQLLAIPIDVLLEHAASLHTRAGAVLYQMRHAGRGDTGPILFGDAGFDLVQEGLEEVDEALRRYRDRFTRFLNLGRLPADNHAGSSSRLARRPPGGLPGGVGRSAPPASMFGFSPAGGSHGCDGNV